MILATIDAHPYAFEFGPETTALLIIDMQRDFVDPKGFGEALGNDVALLRKTIGPISETLQAARKVGMMVIHTREGHRPDLSDLPETKRLRGHLETGIGDEGPMGRILVRGEHGHGIVDELTPLEDEPVIDKPGKGAFYATDLEGILRNRGIRSLIVTGVTAEVCVQSTVREANDRGFECLVLSDCIASYFPEFYEATIQMIMAQGGIFGWIASSRQLLDVLVDDDLPVKHKAASRDQ